MAYDDKTMMTDMLATQKYIASNYNNYAGEISTKQAKNKLMKILSEEHDIQFRIFEDMQAKGWYQVTQAPQEKVSQTVQAHISGATNVKDKKKDSKKRSKTAKKTK